MTSDRVGFCNTCFMFVWLGEVDNIPTPTGSCLVSSPSSSLVGKDFGQDTVVQRVFYARLVGRST